jgi:prolyl 4-hydroxylase
MRIKQITCHDTFGPYILVGSFIYSDSSMEISIEVQNADNHDAEGNHEAALRSLMEGSEKGDLEAKTRLGKRMIVGDRAPNSPKEGVGFIVQAAEAGGPEALAVLSVLFALGVYVRQDWRQALNSLRLSAEKGWSDSRDQLQIIASDRELAAQDTYESDYWLKLAASVDFNYWSSSPEANTLSEAPLVRTLPGLIGSEVCKYLVEKARHRLTRAQVYDSVKRTVTESHTRTNSAAIFNMVETDILNLLVQMRMSAATREEFRKFEAATVLHYAEGEQISEHFDFIDPNTPNYLQVIKEQGQRIITFIIYLNDNYCNGETEFPILGVSHKGTRGEGIYFVNAKDDGSPDRRTLHAGRPPVDGEKWIVTQFIRSTYAL